MLETPVRGHSGCFTMNFDGRPPEVPSYSQRVSTSGRLLGGKPPQKIPYPKIRSRRRKLIRASGDMTNSTCSAAAESWESWSLGGVGPVEGRIHGHGVYKVITLSAG